MLFHRVNIGIISFWGCLHVHVTHSGPFTRKLITANSVISHCTSYNNTNDNNNDEMMIIIMMMMIIQQQQQ